MTIQDFDILRRQDNKTLSRWVNELNCWKWPTEGFDLNEFDGFWRVHHELHDEEIYAYYERQQRRRQEHIDHTNKLSLTGHPREYYKDLQKKMEVKTGMKFIGSLGFMKRELLTSSEWVNVFDEKEVHKDEQTIVECCRKLYDVVKGFGGVITEFDGEEFRVWLIDERMMNK